MGQDTKDYSEDNIIIVKGRFKSNSMNLFGQFILIFNNSKRLDSYNVVVSTFSDAFELEPHTSWEKFEENLVNLKWKGNFNSSMTNSIMDQLKNLSNEPYNLEIIFDNAYNYDYTNLDISLFDMLNRIIHDKNLVLDTGIQELSPQEFQATKENRGKNPSETKDEPPPASSPSDFENQLAEGSVILPIKAIVAPVRGKAIYELKIGDKIMVKILPTSERANYFIDLLGLRDENQRDEKKILPVPAEVIDIKKATGKREPVEILVEIGPGLYGKLIEDEQQIRLKMYNPEIDGPMQNRDMTTLINKNGSNGENKFELSKGSIVMLVLFITILALFLILIALSW